MARLDNDSLSYGRASHGSLYAGAELPVRGPGYVLARPSDPTRFGTERLVAALERAAAAVAETFPGTEPIRIGDLSWQYGGQHPRHGSHRSGRDADLIYYSVDSAGRPVRGRGWLAFNRYGFVRENSGPAGWRASNSLFFLDEPRTWHFIRTLLRDPTIDVQWIFCSWGIKHRLLKYAARHEPDADVLFRASWILHRPTKARPHDDHFHVRIMCSERERQLGCEDHAPIWPWLRHRPGYLPLAARPIADDAELVRELLASAEDSNS